MPMQPIDNGNQLGRIAAELAMAERGNLFDQ
jgi:hypothetical protein